MTSESQQVDRQKIQEYHMHVYYSAGTRDHAVRFRDLLTSLGNGRLRVYSLSDGPRGPHVEPMFGVDIPAAHIAEILEFAMINHGPLSILLHPVTGNDLLDHTHHAFWLGPPRPLDLSILA